MRWSDRALGMFRPVTRRDILQGAGALTAGSLMPGGLLAAAQGNGVIGTAACNPPALTGLRGNHPGSFEVAHALARDGRRDWGAETEPDSDTYDLVVVGAGISGLAAAHFWREQHRDARILIIDNHDDFGGHAKRNEFTVDGRLLIGYGGSQTLESPSDYPRKARRLLRDLAVDLEHFDSAYDQGFYRRNGLCGAVYFDKEAWGESRLIKRDIAKLEWTLPLAPSGLSVDKAVAAMPLSAAARQEMRHLLTVEDDQLEHLSYDEKLDYLSSISYRAFMERHLGVSEPEVFALFRDLTTDLGASAEAVTALSSLEYVGLPGLAAAGLPDDDSEPYIHHFPDGNASIARLLVRGLIPAAAPGSTMSDVVLARFDYSQLDVAGAPVRLRLNSTVVSVCHAGNPATADKVEVGYVRGGKAHRVAARHCIMACNNAIIPAICQELPAEQRDALSRGVKVPVLYTNVALRNWRAWQKLGVGAVSCPGSYHVTTMLDFPVDLGGYEFGDDPSDPVIAHMERFPFRPDAGLTKREQTRVGRLEILTTPFENIERNIRSQLTGILEGGGFDPAEDIAAITVNRWPHGYADRDWLVDPYYDDPNDARYAFVRGRQPLGRIAIANADAGANAMYEEAVVQARRAVHELS